MLNSFLAGEFCSLQRWLLQDSAPPMLCFMDNNFVVSYQSLFCLLLDLFGVLKTVLCCLKSRCGEENPSVTLICSRELHSQLQRISETCIFSRENHNRTPRKKKKQTNIPVELHFSAFCCCEQMAAMSRREWAARRLNEEPIPLAKPNAAPPAKPAPAPAAAGAAAASQSVAKVDDAVPGRSYRLIVRKPAESVLRVLDFSDVDRFERDTLKQPFKIERKAEGKEDPAKPGRRKRKQRVYSEELALVDARKSKYQGIERASHTAEGAGKHPRLFVMQKDGDGFSLIPVSKWYDFSKVRNVIRHTDDEIESKFDPKFRAPDRPLFRVRQVDDGVLNLLSDGPRMATGGRKNASGEDREEEEMLGEADTGGGGAGGDEGGKRRKNVLTVTNDDDMQDVDDIDNMGLDQDAHSSDDFESEVEDGDPKPESDDEDEDKKGSSSESSSSSDDDEEDGEEFDDEEGDEKDGDEPGTGKGKSKKDAKDKGAPTHEEVVTMSAAINKKRKAEAEQKQIAEEINAKKSRSTGAVKPEDKAAIRESIIKYLNRKDMARDMLFKDLNKLFKKASTPLEEREMRDHADIVVLEVAVVTINPYDGKQLLRIKDEFKTK
eukprot:m.233522 g.233522  ORF g.233522 m.233522 type:complete len:605 (-) comp19191_c0_seq1:38-1852(-)